MPRSIIKAARQLERQSIPIPATPPAISKLLTRAQVIERIKLDIAMSSLTEVAARHDISPQQLSDVCHGRASLSKKMLAKLSYKLWEYFEKVG